MADLVVSLYAPALDALGEKVAKTDITIRPVLAPEQRLVVDWVRDNFSDNWASEALVAITRQPSACLIAIRDGKILGFACYDATARGFFGPTGVALDARKQGIGAALLHRTLQTMKTMGYAYAIIGDPGPTQFYVDSVGAIEIPLPGKGIYADMLRAPRK
ncbi:GNAT family N-acetyltransferase [Thalassospira marina]|uniref:GNAT family N-acetyltransferase n=1 Tax=Thalassospira marina TaxID=2048283 RepID=A0A2N3KET5_9PROT|nr:GNAT family N-acetyltransferase [Thalassospira marina]PKR49030.1 GNAT family N-acetyltransferase [Thalassospira marina]